MNAAFTAYIATAIFVMPLLMAWAFFYWIGVAREPTFSEFQLFMIWACLWNAVFFIGGYLGYPEEEI